MNDHLLTRWMARDTCKPGTLFLEELMMDYSRTYHTQLYNNADSRSRPRSLYQSTSSFPTRGAPRLLRADNRMLVSTFEACIHGVHPRRRHLVSAQFILLRSKYKIHIRWAKDAIRKAKVPAPSLKAPAMWGRRVSKHVFVRYPRLTTCGNRKTSFKQPFCRCKESTLNQPSWGLTL